MIRLLNSMVYLATRGEDAPKAAVRIDEQIRAILCRLVYYLTSDVSEID